MSKSHLIWSRFPLENGWHGSFFLEATFSRLNHFRFSNTRSKPHDNSHDCFTCFIVVNLPLSLSLSLNRNLLIITLKCKRKDVFHCKWCSEYKIGQLDVSETERCVTELVTQFYVAPGYSHTFILFVEWSRRDCGGRHKKSMNGRYLLQQDWKRLGCSHLSTIHQ